MLNAISCKHLTFSHTPTSLSFDFTIEIKKNNFALLVGKNGAGKSTFLSLIAGLLKPHSGELYLNGVRMQDQPLQERDLAILFHAYNVFPHLTVFENVAFAFSPYLRLSGAEKQGLIALLEELELTPWLYEKAQILSAGLLQRVALGRCLLQNKSIMLLDEPFSAMDAAYQPKILKWLWEKAKHFQKTVLIITHSPLEREPFIDQVIVLNEGKMKSFSEVSRFSELRGGGTTDCSPLLSLD